MSDNITVDIITPRIAGDIGRNNPVITSSVPYYIGGYEVTPTQETQVLQTAGTQLERNVTVNPIPQNYGLITWNGSFIRVS